VLTRIILLVARCYVKSRDGDLHIRRAFDLLRIPAVRAEFKEREAAIVAAEVEMQRLRGDNRLQELSHFRDKYTAHLGESTGTSRPIYKEFFALAEDTVTLIEMLAHAIGIANTQVRDQIDAGEAAAAFWHPWTRNP
jgi:hypothetical protein